MGTFNRDDVDSARAEAISAAIVREAQELRLLDSSGAEVLREEALSNPQQARKAHEDRMGALYESACIFAAREVGDKLFNEWVDYARRAESARQQILGKYLPGARNKVRDALRDARQTVSAGRSRAAGSRI